MADEPSSWGDALRQYRQKSSNMKIEGATYKVPTRMNMGKLRSMNQFDVIQQKFKDPKKEDLFSKTLKSSMDATRTKVSEKLERKDRGFDILSNTITSPKGSIPKKTRPGIDSKHITRVGYNIVTNQSHRTGKIEPLSKRTHGLRAEKDYRDFDIVSNEYVEDHDGKSSADMQESRRKAAETFHAKRDFDPVKGMFYNPDKEDEFMRTREEKAADNNLTMMHRLPLSYKVSDGMLYNIINGEVVQPEHLEHHEHLLDRRRNLHKRNYKTQAEQRAHGELKQDNENERRLARISHARYTQEQYASNIFSFHIYLYRTLMHIYLNSSSCSLQN